MLIIVQEISVPIANIAENAAAIRKMRPVIPQTR